MAMNEEERKAKQRDYNREYYLSHRERKLEQNSRSARRWRERYPDRYKASQERCRARIRALRNQSPRKPRLRECASCGEIKLHKAREMCVVCYGRWRWQEKRAAVQRLSTL
ncbi:MAG: hypothetical protein ACR2JC_03710 [Chloroflexota bacterium]|nr:MAG: hypothetical protein DLM70_08240 [Chloroflexota bacterium]